MLPAAAAAAAEGYRDGPRGPLALEVGGSSWEVYGDGRDAFEPVTLKNFVSGGSGFYGSSSVYGGSGSFGSGACSSASEADALFRGCLGTSRRPGAAAEKRGVRSMDDRGGRWRIIGGGGVGWGCGGGGGGDDQGQGCAACRPVERDAGSGGGNELGGASS